MLTEKQEKFCQAYLEHECINLASKISGYELKEEYGSQYYVYLLINPLNNKIFYVGKGKNKRAENHLRDNIRGCIDNARKHKTINELLEIGKKPIIRIFINNIKEAQAYDIEKLIIKKFKSGLTNVSSGRQSKQAKQKEWAKTILRKTIPYDVWVSRKERPESHKKLYKECIELLTNVAEGNIMLYDTATQKTVNGKTTVTFT